MRSVLLLILILATSVSLYATIPWPMAPFDSAQPIGNSYGEYQDYGGSPYMHPGIDILHPFGTPVYAVKAGWVKAVLTTSAELHWRVAIGDSDGSDSCDGWLYAHLDQPTITVSVGEHVDSGQFLGNLVQWTVADFHHLHFVKIRNAGLTWPSNWLFVGNALDELTNIDDFDDPYFLDISLNAPFRFCRNNTDTYFNVGSPLDGDVDIIAHAHDKIGHPTWVLCPHEMGYQIYSDSVVYGPFTSFYFSKRLYWDQAQHTVFKNSGPCNSEGDYDQRTFYEILTNHNSDSLSTTSDIAGKWATGQFPNDTYMVKAWAKDRFGNIAWDSMSVATANFYTIDGIVTCSDGNPFIDDIIVSVPYTSSADTASNIGAYALSFQPAGRYAIDFSKEGYQTSSQIYAIFSNQNLNKTLIPVPFINGDADFSGIVDISDAVYLIRFIFSGGHYPIPWASGVNIDPSATIDISDVVYLINYIFNGGPPPGG